MSPLIPAPVAESCAPSLGMMSLEPLRAVFEYASMRLAHKVEPPTGDGHPVVIFPGLGADGRSVAPLRAFCEKQGFSAYEWGRGYNTGPRGDVDQWLADLGQHIQDMAMRCSDRMTLIGWSLGGIYARELAKILPQAVRQVITIGTPFSGSAQSTNVGRVYRFLNGSPAELDLAMARRLATAPSVPTTSIYSRSDGIVAWQACVQHGPASHVENIEVQGSHCGLGWNRDVLDIIADRLHQPEGQWTHYRPLS